MPKLVLPDQSVFPTDPINEPEYFKEDQEPDNPFFEKWLYREDKADGGYLRSQQFHGNAQRHFLNKSPTLKVSKKLVPPDTSIGNFSPYLIK